MTFKGKSFAYLCGAASIVITDLLIDPNDVEAKKIANEWLKGYVENKYRNKIAS